MKRYLIRFALVSGMLGSATSALADSFGGSTTSASATVETQTTDQKVPYYGLTFDFTFADGTGLNSVGQNYRNDLAFYFEPSWMVGARFLKNTAFKTLTIAGRFAVTQNLAGTDESNFNGVANSGPHGTCSNITPATQGGVVNPSQVGYCNPAGNNRRSDYSDIWLTLKAPKIYTIPKVDVSISPSLRFILPSSAESQFQTLALAISPAVGFGRSFWKDRIRLGYSLSFTKNFHRADSAQLDPKTGGLAGTSGDNSFDGAVGTSISNFYVDPSRAGSFGGLNVNYSVAQFFSGGIQFSEKWSVDVLYILIDAFAYDTPCDFSAQGVTINTCQAGNAVAASSGAALNRPGRRDTQVFWATLQYQALDWLGVSLAWINWAPLQKPDSTYRQGIISADYNAFTTLQLGATVTIDKLASKFRKN